jgi:hypothetical protein
LANPHLPWIETIEGHDIILEDDGRITYTAKAAIDDDGSGPSLGDPDFRMTLLAI